MINLNNVDSLYKKAYEVLFNDNQNSTFKRISSHISENQHLQGIEKIKSSLIKSQGMAEFDADNILNSVFGFIVINNQNELLEKNDLSYLHKISKYNFYIKHINSLRNIDFEYKSKYGKIIITINKSKPERVNVIPEIKQESKNTPKCLICIENVGWKGSAVYSSKENLRTKNIELDKENWFMQFSPFPYFQNHLIVIAKEHKPMTINGSTIKRFIDFLKINPDYFIGSNAGLPLIGGTLLAHDHYQAGTTPLPLMKQKPHLSFNKKDIKVDFLKWPVSTIKISSLNHEALIETFNNIFQNWKKANLKNIPNQNNNSVSLLSKVDKKGELHLWISFRNNYTNKKYPRGVYGIKEKRQNIKKEALGLIEIGGLAILPGRLEKELKKLINVHLPSMTFDDDDASKHYQWLMEYANKKNKVGWKDIEKYIGDTFIKALEDNDPFENDFKNFAAYIKKII